MFPQPQDLLTLAYLFCIMSVPFVLSCTYDCIKAYGRTVMQRLLEEDQRVFRKRMQAAQGSILFLKRGNDIEQVRPLIHPRDPELQLAATHAATATKDVPEPFHTMPKLEDVSAAFFTSN